VSPAAAAPAAEGVDNLDVPGTAGPALELVELTKGLRRQEGAGCSEPHRAAGIGVRFPRP